MIRSFSRNWKLKLKPGNKALLDQVCSDCNRASRKFASSTIQPGSTTYQISRKYSTITQSNPNANADVDVDSSTIIRGRESSRSSSSSSRPEKALGSENKRQPELDPFQKLGLNPLLTSQVLSAFPQIHFPTLAQQSLIPAILSPNDVLLRAHTGTGKSFSLLLSLLSKPRLLFKDPISKVSKNAICSILIVPTNELASQYLNWSKKILPSNLKGEIDNVVQVLCKPDGTSILLEKDIPEGKEGQKLSLEKSLEKLQRNPPHLLIATPTRLKEVLDLSGYTSFATSADPIMLLNLRNLKTLALDEADLLLSLPGRFPSKKLAFKKASPFISNLNHRSPTLEILNQIMKIRPSFSGGSLKIDSGMEISSRERSGDERRPPESVRRTQYVGIERSNDRWNDQDSLQGKIKGKGYASGVVPGGFSIPIERSKSSIPALQLVMTSATANAVLRHFLGARTGWLRTGIKDLREGGRDGELKVESGRWIDLTGLSGVEKMGGEKDGKKKEKREAGGRWEVKDDFRDEVEGMMIPKELDHCCVVVDDGIRTKDEGSNNDDVDSILSLPKLRNLDFKRLHKLATGEQDFYSNQSQITEEASSTDRKSNFKKQKPVSNKAAERQEETVETSSLEEHQIDNSLLDALAFCFASEGVNHGLAVIPSRWSLRSVRSRLEALGVPVRFVGEETSLKEKTTPVLMLIQATSARGLDLKNLSHVFIVGIHSIGDAVRYTHLAGRASRIGHENNQERSEEQSQNEESNLDSSKSVSNSSRPQGKVISLIKGAAREFLKSKPSSSTPNQNKDDDFYLSRFNSDDSSKARRELGLDLLPIGTEEKKISMIYRRLRLRPVRFDLSLLNRSENLQGETENGLLGEVGSETRAQQVITEGVESPTQEAEEEMEISSAEESQTIKG